MHRLQNTAIIATLFLCISLPGCAAQPSASDNSAAQQKHDNPSSASSPFLDQPSASSNESAAESFETISGTCSNRNSVPDSNSYGKSNDVDLDLTSFSPNMLYAEVFHITSTPEDFIGKTIKICGQFGCFNELDQNGVPIPNRHIFVCIISDAMACCATGIEFIPTEEIRSANLPNEGALITVTGVCDITMDDIGLFPIVQLHDAQINQET